MLTIYRRHLKSCPHRSQGRKYRRCRCPIYVDGLLGDREIRESLKRRNWEKAQDIVREWEARGQQTEDTPPEPITVAGAWRQFRSDCEARGLREPTLKKYEQLSRPMERFAEQRGLRYLREFDIETLGAFRASWPNQNLSALKKLELLRTFFRFAQDSGWV